MAFLALLAALIIIPIVIGALRAGGGAKKFQRLGDIRGMEIKDIVAKVGPPSSISEAGGGKRLYQWMKISGRSGYHYAIRSDGEGRAEGFTHQWAK